MRREAPVFQPEGPGYARRVHARSGRPRTAQQTGACLLRAESGFAGLEPPCREDHTRQHGSIHDGNSNGFAACPGMSAVACGASLAACGATSRPGHTLTVPCTDVFGVKAEEWNLRVVMQTATVLPDRTGCTA